MADRNIDEKFRKPRRAKGTPFYSQRNYLALGICLFGGLSWYLFELWPLAKKLKKSQYEGRFEDPPALKERLLQMQIATSGNQELIPVLEKLRARAEAKAEEERQASENAQPQPCSRRTEKISKYFIKPDEKQDDTTKKCNQESDSSSSIDSPYKLSLTDMKTKLDDSISDENDFTTPKSKLRIKPKPPINNIPKVQEKKIKSKGKTKKFVFKENIQENIQNSDVNPYHLQLALALSASTQQDGSLNECDDSDSVPVGATQKRARIKSTLEQFGFKTGKPVLAAEQKRQVPEVYMKRKKSRYLYVTPILVMRTEEDREAIITAKVSMILSNILRNQLNTIPRIENPKLFSTILQDLQSKDKSFFKLNSVTLEALNVENVLYTEALSLPKSEKCCGCLLKNWKNIPGREPSPPRKVIETRTSTEQSSQPPDDNMEPAAIITIPEDNPELCEKPTAGKISQSKSGYMSPDLFDDDDDDVLLQPTHFTPQKGNDEKKVSKFSLEEFEDDHGICHFESFNEDHISLSQKQLHQSRADVKRAEEEFLDSLESSQIVKVYDLTLSSSDDETDAENGDLKANGINKTMNEDISLKLSPTEEQVLTDKIAAVDNVNNESCNIDNDSDKQYSQEIVSPKSQNHTKVSHMSPIYLSSSNENDLEECQVENCKDISPEQVEVNLKKENTFEFNRFSVGFDIGFNSSKKLDVTNYIHDMLTQSFDNADRTSHEKSQAILPNENCSQITHENTDITNEKVLTCSQESSLESNYISDEELNYSSYFNFPDSKKPTARKKLDYCNKGFKKIHEISDSDSETENMVVTTDTDDQTLKKNYNVSTISTLPQNIHDISTPTKSESAAFNDSFHEVLENISTLKELEKQVPSNNIMPSTSKVATPKNSVIIKTDNVTPMADYDKMNTPNIVKELDKYGLKPLKRQRGAKLLKYIYESTHPIVESKEAVKVSSDEDEDMRVVKKRKNENNDAPLIENKLEHRKFLGKSCENSCEIVGEIITGVSEELIFERKQSSRILSCRIPLDIVWHNFISSNKQIRENILMYEPLQLEVLHSMLKELGYKFHIQDLLTFLDRKCVTVRTAQGQGNGKRRK